tara:strand:+ start:121 stop:417 length:297 start_codon:yes stop_codon:yes gene_type:complete
MELLNMKLKCQTFEFYSNGEYRDVRVLDSNTATYGTDIKEISKVIRILGTQEQIDKALDDYCQVSGLNLDEAFNFTDKDKIKEYTKHYKNKGLIINLI